VKSKRLKQVLPEVEAQWVGIKKVAALFFGPRIKALNGKNNTKVKSSDNYEQ
jgi:hypothetical protein